MQQAVNDTEGGFLARAVPETDGVPRYNTRPDKNFPIRKGDDVGRLRRTEEFIVDLGDRGVADNCDSTTALMKGRSNAAFRCLLMTTRDCDMGRVTAITDGHEAPLGGVFRHLPGFRRL